MTQQSIRDRIISKQQGTTDEDTRTEPAVSERPSNLMRRRGLLYGTVGLAVAVGVALAGYFYAGLGQLTAEGTASRSVASADGGNAADATPFDRHVRQAGLASCYKVFPALGDLVTRGSTYMVQSQWNGQSGAPRSIQAVTGQDYDDADFKGKAVGVVFASTSTSQGICEGSIVRVTPTQKSCEDATKSMPQGSSLSTDLKGIPVYNVANGGGQALLLPSAGGCVVVSLARTAG